jgi:hypothetical protein
MVMLFSGSDLDSPVTTIRGTAGYDFAGGTVAVLGDVDGDGWSDLAIGAAGTDGYTGASHLFYGPLAALPQTQCTRCGYPDCAGYAEAIAAGQAEINQCPPSGAEGIARLARIAGRAVLPLNPDNGVEAHAAQAPRVHPRPVQPNAKPPARRRRPGWL